MTQIQEVNVEARANRGKGPAYQARQKGLTPAIIYGGKDQPETISVDSRTLERQIEKGAFLTTLLMLSIGGKKTRVIPRQVQLDPVSDRPVHVDFLRLAEGATVRLDIPVHFKGQGESPGLKKGGVLLPERVQPIDALRDPLIVKQPLRRLAGTVRVEDGALIERLLDCLCRRQRVQSCRRRRRCSGTKRGDRVRRHCHSSVVG